MNRRVVVVAASVVLGLSLLAIGWTLLTNDISGCATSDDLASADVGVHYDRFSDRTQIGALPTFRELMSEMLAGYAEVGEPMLSIWFECAGDRWCRPDSLDVLLTLYSGDERLLQGADSLRFLVDRTHRSAFGVSGYNSQVSRIASMSRYEEEVRLRVSAEDLEEVVCGTVVEYRAGTVEGALNEGQRASLRAMFVRDYVDSLLLAKTQADDE